MATYICDGRCKRGACGCGMPKVLGDGDKVINTLVFSDAARDGIPFRDDQTNDAEDARAAMIADMAGEHRKVVVQPEAEGMPDKPDSPHVVATDEDAANAYAKMVKDMQSAHRLEAAE